MIGIVSRDAVFARMLVLLLAEYPTVAGHEGAEVCLWDADSVPAPPAGAKGLLVLSRREPETLPAGAQLLRRPFPHGELRRRVAALVAASDAAQEAVLRLDDGTHSAAVGSVSVSFSGAEYRLLRALSDARGAPLGRREAAALFGKTGSNVVEVYISYLRKKLAALPGGVCIVTVRGRGYLLQKGDRT